MKYFENYESSERNLLGKVPGWVVLDHPDTFKMDVSGENTAMNCLYFGALNSAAWLAQNIIGDLDQAKLWYEKAPFWFYLDRANDRGGDHWDTGGYSDTAVSELCCAYTSG